MKLLSRGKKIGIIGSGGWGTALAQLLSENGHKATLWCHEEETAEEINKYHTNKEFLPDVNLSKSLLAVSADKKLKGQDIYVIATPTQYIRTVFEKNDFHIKDKPVINVAKGIEQKTLFRVSQIVKVAAGVSPENYVVLTGPSHAEEVARKTPTTVVAASDNYSLAKECQDIFNNEKFRVYTSEDVTGCELGGSLKNVIAIAAGIIDGLELGDNTKAALITRGLAEITRLGVALGAKQETFSGLSGLGDLFVTCNSRHSRNRSVGEKIGRGKSAEDITKDMKMVAEGVKTTESAYELGLKHDVEMPISAQMYKILFEKQKPQEAINELMTRRTKREWWW